MSGYVISKFSRWFYFISLFLSYSYMSQGYYIKSTFFGSVNGALYGIILGLLTFVITVFLAFIIFRNSTRSINNLVVILLNIISLQLLFFLLSGMIESRVGFWVEHTTNSTGVLYRYYYIHPIVGAFGVYISIAYYYSKYLLSINNTSEYKHVFRYEYVHRLLPYIPLIVYLVILFVHNYLPKPYFNG
ncbi:hypothetical protein MNBD_GAMMA12-1287 [hydrothermal vent metagenome]|uniref:Uncharacterized protein n=1 Tax=hydrothermal vent metagenome TaxID=652676 RepID=A0A3B0YQK1_9ZZZZ